MQHSDNNLDSYEYLCVDGFLSDFLHTQTLKSAFAIGLIELLSKESSLGFDDLSVALSIDPEGMTFLLDLLEHNNVVKQSGGTLSLTQEFVRALKYRSLLEIKIEFANYLAPDLINYFNDYLKDMDKFMQHSAVFDLFSYHRCYESTEENIAITGKWMKYTSALTHYEAKVFLDLYSISDYKSVIDIGGNSGEFALQLCLANPELTAIVVDLPVVCDIGQKHIHGKIKADRIRFLKADVSEDDLPTGLDLVIFKSMLHDWPEGSVDTYISKAYDSLRPGGDIVIYERINDGKPVAFPTYGNLPLFIFMRFYRNTDLYSRLLGKNGFSEIKIKFVQLDMPFAIISAKKLS